MPRLFIGIEASGDVKSKILSWRQAYQGLKLRWILEDNHHITMVPPWHGEVDNELLDKLTDLAQGFKSFSIKMHGIRFAPKSRSPRYIWLDIKPSRELAKLHQALCDLMDMHESRKFKPHVTLARFRTEDFTDFPVKHIGEEVNWQQKVDSFTLYQSSGQANTPYKLIQKFTFT